VTAIADQLEKPCQSVKTSLFRLRNKFRRMMPYFEVEDR
jgi:hypothetical protein